MGDKEDGDIVGLAELGLTVGEADVGLLDGDLEEGLPVFVGLLVGRLVGFALGLLLDGFVEGATDDGRCVGPRVRFVGIEVGLRVGTELGANGSFKTKSGSIETVACAPAIPAFTITGPEPAGGIIKVALFVRTLIPL